MTTFQGHTAMIGRNETIEHVLADRARLKKALERCTNEEKRASLTERLGEIEAHLAMVKAALADL